MSDNNKGISPFKDPAFLKGSDKTRRANVSDDDIKEFRKAFSDEEDVKKFTPSSTKKSRPAPEKKSDDDLYAVQSVDIDAIMESLSGVPAKEDGKAASPVKKDKKLQEVQDGKTRSFSLSSSVKKKISETVRVPGEEKKHKKERARSCQKQAV